MDLQTRVVNILTRPASEWPVIAEEPADVRALYRNYIVLLAAIPAVCTFLYSLSLVAAIMSYVATLASVYVAALVIEKLAPNFDSRGNTAQALKLVAYALTPVWIAGVLYLIPMLGMLMLLAAFYAAYLFYLGVAPVMKTPPDKVVPYMVVSALVVVVVTICLQVLLGTLSGTALPGGAVVGARAF